VETRTALSEWTEGLAESEESDALGILPDLSQLSLRWALSVEEIDREAVGAVVRVLGDDRP
jgi:hypothetical protein